jgi:hypothetical protein
MKPKKEEKLKKLSKVADKLPRAKDGNKKRPKSDEVKDKGIEIINLNEKAAVGERHYTLKYKEAEIDIKKSANAWWGKLGKLQEFCQALRIGCEILEACVYTGITYEQWRYFKDEHPEFSQLKDMLQEWPIMRLRHTAVNGGLTDPKVAVEMLQILRPSQFNKRRVVEHKGLRHANFDDETNPESASKADEASSNLLAVIGSENFDEDDES